MKHIRMWIGLAFWCGLLGVLGVALEGQGATTRSTSRQYVSNLWSYYTSSRRLELQLPQACELSVGDPVFAADRNGWIQQVGLVVSLSDPCTARAVCFPSAPELGRPVHAYYLRSPDSIEWVVQTLLPPERRKQVEEELTAALQEHHQEILQALQPVVNKSVAEALAVLEQDLPMVLDKHRPELQAIADRDKEEILKKELIPLVKTTVWPIVRRDSEPLVRQISSELWERVSLWSLAWRGLADKMPVLRGKKRLEHELERFLDQEAIPILESHEEHFLALIEIIMRDIADNDHVRAAWKRSLAKVAEDPRLQRVLNDILQEALLKNPRFWKSVRQNLNTAEAQEVLRLAGNRLEPTIRRIGDLVLGTHEGGLTPEFNRVLRQQILLKDRHGILVGELPPSGLGLQCIPLEAWFSGAQP